MTDRDYNVEKLNILQVAKDSIILCKDNYKPLLQISFLSFLIFLFNTFLSYIKLMVAPGLAYSIYNIISFIVFFPIAYLDMKLTVTLWLTISKRYNREQITTKEAFSLSAKTTWSYIGTSILYSLMLVPIVVIFMPLFFMIKVAALKWILISFAAILILYLGIIYGFAPIAAALEGSKESNFRLSKRLVDGNLWRIMLLQFIIVAIGFSSVLVNNINPWFKNLMPLSQIAAQIGYQSVYLFISPFIAAASIVLYLTLRNMVVFVQDETISNTVQE